MGVLKQIWLYEIYGEHISDMLPQCGCMKHGLKDNAFYVQTHTAPRAVYYIFWLVRDKPLGVTEFVRLVLGF